MSSGWSNVNMVPCIERPRPTNKSFSRLTTFTISSTSCKLTVSIRKRNSTSVARSHSFVMASWINAREPLLEAYHSFSCEWIINRMKWKDKTKVDCFFSSINGAEITFSTRRNFSDNDLVILLTKKSQDTTAQEFC